jgi:hypothetical protein
MSDDKKHEENDASKHAEPDGEIAVMEDLIDLEEWAKAGRKPQRAKRYRIRIDKEHKIVEVHSMKGREILALVNKTPETHMLSQKLRGGRVEPVGADQVVEFDGPGVERFQTLALDPTEG